MMGDNGTGPSSWRDVYELVRDTRSDIMVAVGNVDTKVTLLTARVESIEDDRRDEKVVREAAEKRATARNRTVLAAISASRGGIALIVSVLALIITFTRGAHG